MEKRPIAPQPLVSVIICTRDRPRFLLTAVQSALADAPADGTVEVLVVDQGHTDETAQALTTLMASDHRLRYQRERSTGLSCARNAGLRSAQGVLPALTDDDCEVVPGWIRGISMAFAAHAGAGIVFGHVACAPHNPTQGYLPGFKAWEGMLTRKRLLAGAGYWGMGANMALRRSTWERLGPFDEWLGAGAPLQSAEDVDYTLRAVRMGIAIYHTPQARVIHYGFRPWRDASVLMRGTALGVGAMYAKHLRTGGPFVTLLWLNDLRERCWNLVCHLLRGSRPLGANALLAFVQGFWRGLRLPVQRDPAPVCFQPQPPPSLDAAPSSHRRQAASSSACRPPRRNGTPASGV
jgi:GT2 family glycosyltransferase